MSKFTVYLAGTIDPLNLEESCSWRGKLSDYLDSRWDIVTLDPCRHFKSRDVPFLPTKKKDIEQVIEQDLKDIWDSDCVFCYFLGQLSVGSCMEIFYAAHNLQKPVIVVAEDKLIRQSIWIKYWATKITRSFSTGIKAIIEQQCLWLKEKEAKCNEAQ